MNKRSIILTLLLGLFGVSAFAADGNMGTWKLNEAKSTFPAGATKNTTVVYSAESDMIKVVVDGASGEGKPLHNEWKGKFDGKDYPVTGDPVSDSRAYTRVDDRKVKLIVKKDGKVTATGHIVLSVDGKSRTLEVKGTDAKGNKVTSTAVYDKQ